MEHADLEDRQVTEEHVDLEDRQVTGNLKSFLTTWELQLHGFPSKDAVSGCCTQSDWRSGLPSVRVGGKVPVGA